MSHFTVLVVGESINDIEKQLAPFHEFECTGIDNEYVVDVDITEEYKSKLATYTQTKYKDPDGNYHSPYDNQFYRELTSEEEELLKNNPHNHNLHVRRQDWDDGKGYRPKVHFLPEGWTEEGVSFKSVLELYVYDHGEEAKRVVKHGESPDLSGKHKYGYALLDENGEVVKIIDRTNPNRKWDWYQIGGRWAGHFKLKDGITREEDGMYDTVPNFSYGWDKDSKIERIRNVDSAYKKDIDFESKMNHAAELANERWEFVHKMIDFNQPFTSWKEYLKLHETLDKPLNECRDEYHKQAIYIQWSELGKSQSDNPNRNIADLLFGNLDEYFISREDYVKSARISSFQTFAILKDGVWYERGKMGWWACVSDEDSDWQNIYMKIFDSIPDDALLTIVDCHI